MAKFALLINGDTETKHLYSIERSLTNYFEAQGGEENWETYVASPKNPSAPHDHYYRATPEDIQKMVADLKGKMGPEDDLFIYTTGHGDLNGDEATLVLENGGQAEFNLAQLLDGIPSKTRRVVMDQCYGGNWNKVFTDDPKTLFVSAGSRNEITYSEMAPKLWAQAGEIPDLNGDGAISWQERYAYAFAAVKSSEPQFLVSPGYREEGAPPFENRVVKVATRDQLKQQLKKLHPGQYAIIAFSTVWCGPCETYAPKFDQMAEEGGGKHLFLRTGNKALMNEWGIPSVPTVMIVNANGQKRIVEDRYNPEGELAAFELTEKERLLGKIDREFAATEKIESPSYRSDAFQGIAYGLAKAGLGEKAVPLFDHLIAAAEKIENPSYRPGAFQGIAYGLAKAGLGEKAVPLFDHLIAAAEKIEYPSHRSVTLRGITDSLAVAELGEKAVPLFDRLIAAAKKIEYPKYRSDAFRRIADGLAEAGSKEKATFCFESSIAVAEKIEDAFYRSKALREIAGSLAETGLKDRVAIPGD